MMHPLADPLHLGDDALAYAREELATAAYDFDGPLARRLVDVALGSPFTLLSREGSERARGFRQGGVDAGASDECLAVGISRWLSKGPGPTGTRRVLLLEDPLARRSDPLAAGEALYFGERVYFAGRQGDGPERIGRLLRQLAGYPGIGAISELAAEDFGTVDLSESALDRVTSAAAAVLVRAWDDEAFVVVPVGARLTSDDLRC